MRRDGDDADVSLLGAPLPSHLHAVAGAVVSKLPRGKRFAITVEEALSIAVARARRARMWVVDGASRSRRRKALSASNSYAPRR
jgi:hypothetical protein